MKPVFFLLLSIYAGASVALAQITPTPVSQRPVAAPEMDWAVAGSALIVLAGVVAIMRGRRRN